MKALLQLLILLFTTSLSAQSLKIHEDAKFWLPQEFVECLILSKNLDSCSKVRRPVESFLLQDSQLYVKTFGGKFVKAIVSHEQESGKKELLHVKNGFNLHYFTRDDFKEARFFLTFIKGRALLEINESNKTDSVFFISAINGYNFELPIKSYRMLLLEGNYREIDKEKNIRMKFNLDGTINGNSKWDAYTLRKVNAEQIDGKLYHLIELISNQKNTTQPFAFTYNAAESSWHGFRYKHLPPNKIEILTADTLQLKRLTNAN